MFTATRSIRFAVALALLGFGSSLFASVVPDSCCCVDASAQPAAPVVPACCAHVCPDETSPGQAQTTRPPVEHECPCKIGQDGPLPILPPAERVAAAAFDLVAFADAVAVPCVVSQLAFESPGASDATLSAHQQCVRLCRWLK